MRKARQLLSVAIFVGVLVSTLALPALAIGDDIPMWVHRIRLAYVGRNCSCPDRMVAQVHIRDATKAMVDEAEVTAKWTITYATGGDPTEVFQTGATDAHGIVEFSVSAAQAGEYELCIVGVKKDGWGYDPGLDREVCPVISAY